MKPCLFLISALLFSIRLFSQIPYFEDGLWGLKDKDGDIILIEPRYKAMVIYRDTMLLVFSGPEDNKRVIQRMRNQALVDFKGDTLGYPADNNIWMSTDPYHPSGVFKNETVPYGLSFLKQDEIEYTYLIDPFQRCIPADYYPCPFFSKIITDSIPQYLQLIHQAQRYRTIGDFQSAILYIMQAIELVPENSYPHFLVGEYLLKYDGSYYMAEVNTDSKEWLLKARSLENRDIYRLKINSLLYELTRKEDEERDLYREILTESKRIASTEYLGGMAFIVGYEFTQPGFVELGWGISSLTRQKSSSLIVNKDLSFIQFGGSLLFAPHISLHGIKMYLFSIHAPIRIGISPMLIFNSSLLNDNIKWMFRPELGYTWRNFTVFYGYNLFKKSEVFHDMARNTMGMRFLLRVKPYRGFEY